MLSFFLTNNKYKKLPFFCSNLIVSFNSDVTLQYNVNDFLFLFLQNKFLFINKFFKSNLLTFQFYIVAILFFKNNLSFFSKNNIYFLSKQLQSFLSSLTAFNLSLSKDVLFLFYNYKQFSSLNCDTTYNLSLYQNIVNHKHISVKYLNSMYNVPVTANQLLSKYIKFTVRGKRYNTIITSLKNIFNISYFFKKNSIMPMETLLDICVSDYPTRLRRFELFYCFLSVTTKSRLFLKTFFTDTSAVASISLLYKSADWLEREAWDMFGVFFYNHPNLRRILTDYGFRGHPMRKDFPLTGYIEVRFDDERYSVVYEPLEMAQEFRVYNFKSPWEKSII